MSFVLTSTPPPAPPKDKREKFPAKTFGIAFAAAACLFYYSVWVLPGADPGGSSLGGLLVGLGKMVSAQPLVLLGVLALSFLPAVVKRFGVKEYLVRVGALFIILLGGMFLVAEHPFDIFHDEVESALKMDRPLPH